MRLLVTYEKEKCSEDVNSSISYSHLLNTEQESGKIKPLFLLYFGLHWYLHMV